MDVDREDARLSRIARDFNAQQADKAKMEKAKMAEPKQDDSEKGGLAAAPPLQQYGATEPAGKEGSLAKSDVAEQHLEKAGVFGGHGGTMCFFAVFEGFTCVWLTIFLCLLIQRIDVAFIFLLFGCCFHCVTQGGITMMDPGAVNATLESLETGMDDEHTAAVLEELRKVPATVKVVAEASHTETTTCQGENQQTTTTTVIDHREDAKFSYASWKDVSGRVAGLDEYKVAAVEVVPQIECADAATTASLQSLTQRVLETCKKHIIRSGRADSRKNEIKLKHPKYEVGGSRVFVTRSAGEEHASWMNTDTYTACRFAWPGLGTVYRILLFTSVANVRYTITKCISVNKQQGDGWNECQDV